MLDFIIVYKSGKSAVDFSNIVFEEAETVYITLNLLLCFLFWILHCLQSGKYQKLTIRI